MNLPGVGHNLQDHVATFGLTWLVDNSAYNPFLYTADPRTWISWKLNKGGPLASTVGVEVMIAGFFSPVRVSISRIPA